MLIQIDVKSYRVVKDNRKDKIKSIYPYEHDIYRLMQNSFSINGIETTSLISHSAPAYVHN